MGLWTRLTVVAAVSYLTKSVYDQFKTYRLVPFQGHISEMEKPVRPWLDIGTPIRIELFLSNEGRGRQVSRDYFDEIPHLGGIDTTIGYPSAGLFESWGLRKSPPAQREVFQIPDSINRTQAVYLHAFVCDQHDVNKTMLLQGTVHKITHWSLVGGKTWNDRYLLREPFPPKIVAKPTYGHAISTVVEIGPPLASGNPGAVFEYQDMRTRGYAHYVLPGHKMKFSSTRDATINTQGMYLAPPLHVNSMVSARDEMTPLPEAEEIVLEVRPVSLIQWRLQKDMSSSLDEMERRYKFPSYDIDSMKMMVGGTALPVLVGAYVISVLHLLFECLSLAADISWWRRQEERSLQSISSNTFILETLFSTIIFLYLKETNESKLVLYIVGIKLILDLWKLWKLGVIVIKLDFPFITLSQLKPEVDGLSENKKRQLADLDRFEKRGVGYLMFCLLPFVVVVCVFQLIMRKQKGWYSWLIRSLAILAYTGGFVAMTPQLFRNYKLRSVDHLPWLALTYQAINTFIDDVFSFLIRMPSMHRMSVFRDDVVFLVYMGQRIWYRREREEEGEAVEDKKPQKNQKKTK